MTSARIDAIMSDWLGRVPPPDRGKGLALRMLNHHEYVVEILLEYGSFPSHFQAMIG